MSFDLFVVVPSLSVELARSFNRHSGRERPAGLEFDLATCEESSACWELKENGEDWLEVYPNREASANYTYLPKALAGFKCELHLPSRGHPSVFRVAALLAKLGGGMVMDPQGSSADTSLEVPADQMDDLKQGFYTPEFALQIADYLEKNYRWD